MTDKTYTTDEMGYRIAGSRCFAANFFTKHAYLFKNTTDQNAILARADLIKRIHLGEQIVKNLEKKQTNECIDSIQDICEEIREEINNDN